MLEYNDPKVGHQTLENFHELDLILQHAFK